MTCDKCGKTLQVGDYPFCKNGYHGRFNGAVQPDDYIGGLTIENLAPDPVTFYSRSEHRRYLKEHGFIEKVRHVPLQGSDKSPHTTRWDAAPQDLNSWSDPDYQRQRRQDTADWLGMSYDEYMDQFYTGEK